MSPRSLLEKRAFATGITRIHVAVNISSPRSWNAAVGTLISPRAIANAVKHCSTPMRSSFVGSHYGLSTWLEPQLEPHRDFYVGGSSEIVVSYCFIWWAMRDSNLQPTD